MFICCSRKQSKARPASQTERKEPREATVTPSDQQSVKNSAPEEATNKGSVHQSTQVTFLAPETTEQQQDSMDQLIQQIKDLRNRNQVEKSVRMESDNVMQYIQDDTLPDMYILEQQWAVQYTNFLKGKKLVSIGPINNNVLLRKPSTQRVYLPPYDNTVLKDKVTKDKHYVLLNEKAWTFIIKLYGGGPEIMLGNNRLPPRPPQEMAHTVQITSQQTSDSYRPSSNEQSRTQSRFISKSTNRNEQSKVDVPKVELKPIINTIPSLELQIVGLQNPRFYCYMNSALQCLLSMPNINEQLYQIPNRNYRYVTAYQELLRRIQSVKERRIPVIAAQSIWSICSNKFAQNQQQDSHEFLLFLLGQMQEEIVGKYKCTQEFKSAAEAWRDYSSRNNNIIDQTFAGQITSRSHCKNCNKHSEGYDPLWDLSIPINKSWLGRDFDLRDSLKQHFKEETINDKWKCDTCKVINRSVKRSLLISQTPKILVIQLKRFQVFPKREKVTDGVMYPETLDIREFCSNDQQQTQYKLKALIVHMGQINGGHYYSYAKRNGHWYLFDDDSVSNLRDGTHLQEKQAYVLFYEKV